MAQLALLGGTPVRDKPWPRWPTWGEEERQRLEQVLASGEWGGFNEFVSEFEDAFAQRHGAKHCIAAANGTLTLEAALRVHGVGPGDEVIVPPYTFIATANAVRMTGARLSSSTWNRTRTTWTRCGCGRPSARRARP